ncbi:hypothetical protein PRZ48_015031 [Zasmidium cellare]|uniref:Uncharacterized protein n=1 Tax=Zasmidium cellare TaxID=395010 RepID=A0ABR0DXF8_ZASCE|nr:hypothetical protein PRZ48_015031 [Zasmidium cellare]
MDSAHPNHPLDPPNPDKFTTETTSLHAALSKQDHINPDIARQAIHQLELTARERAQIREGRRKILARQRDGEEVLLHPPVPREEWPRRAFEARPRRFSATTGPVDIMGRPRIPVTGRPKAASVSVVGSEGEEGEFSIWAKRLRRDSSVSASEGQRRDTVTSLSSTICNPSISMGAIEDVEGDLEAGRSPYLKDQKGVREYGTLPTSSVNLARRQELELARRQFMGMQLVACVVVGLVLVLVCGWVAFMARWDEVAGEE